MFAIIETKGASHIAIYIPHEGADKSLPALASMLERNATFIAKSWRDLSLVKPTMSIVLGDRIRVDGDETPELVIAESGAVISEDFVPATAEAMVSAKKSLESLRSEKDKLSAELNFLRQQKLSLESRVAELERAAESATN